MHLVPPLVGFGVLTTNLVKWGPREPVRLTEVMPNQKPMSSSEDYESESCPESDKSALLVAQVKLPCEFEI